MAAKKASAEEWAEYLALYQQLRDQLAREPWFADGWETRFDYLNRENPRGVWLQLVRKTWFDGAIHLETWINNSLLQSQEIPVVLHVETSIPKHGISRNDFTKRFLEQVGDQIASWPGYTVKPNYAMEPFNTRVRFTKETLVPVLKAEFSRLQQLGDTIDATIEAVRRS
jgi:hypothetical protein